MWNSKRSTVLSLVLTYVLGAILIAAMIFAPSFVSLWYAMRADVVKTIFITFYSCCPFGFAALFCLLRLIGNIRKEKVFVDSNTTLLRCLSWCCFAVALITLISGYFYLPFLIFCCAAAFLGLILRVVKNVMAEAIALKNENELTI